MKTKKDIRQMILSRSTLAAFLLLVIIASIVFRDKNFLSTNNVFNILLKAAKNGGFLALGMTFVILCAEIDLSVGAVFALSGVVMGLVGQFNPILGIVCGLLVGVASGLMIGCMVTKMRISSWIASLAMMFALRGIISIIAKKSVAVSGSILTFANTQFFKGMVPGMKSGISILVFILFLMTFLCMYVARNTKFGMGIYAVGGNAQAAKFSGINVQKVKFIVYTYTGIMSGIAGLVVASRLYSGQPTAGDGAEMDAIAAVVVGGTSMSGGSGRLGGTLIGVLIIGVLNNGLNLLGVDSNWQYIVKGLVILLAVYVDFIRNKKAGR